MGISLRKLFFHTKTICDMPIITIANCKNLEKFSTLGLTLWHLRPNLVNFLKQNYSKHCMGSHSPYLSRILSTKMSFCCNLSDLSEFQYPSMIEYLHVMICSPCLPLKDGWENYKTMLALCPGIKGVFLSVPEDNFVFSLQENIETCSHNKIWKERILYFNSLGIKVLNKKEYHSKFKQLCKPIRWGFEFC